MFRSPFRPSKSNVLAGTCLIFQSMWNPQFTPFGSSVLATTSPRVHFPLELTFLASTLSGVSDFDTICNDPSPLLADLIIFGSWCLTLIPFVMPQVHR